LGAHPKNKNIDPENKGLRKTDPAKKGLTGNS
jgi:hypothetical protein